MRKLIEAPAMVANQIRNINVTCLEYPGIGVGVDELNWYHFEKHFDFGTSTKSSINVRNLLNEIIHSFLFAFATEESETPIISGFLVASDRKKNARLLEITIANYVQLIQQVADSNPTFVSYQRTRNGLQISAS